MGNKPSIGNLVRAKHYQDGYTDGKAAGRLELEHELMEAIADYGRHDKPGHYCDVCLVLRPAVRLGQELGAEAAIGE